MIGEYMIKDSMFILYWMIFMHIVDDYYLQGIANGYGDIV